MSGYRRIENGESGCGGARVPSDCGQGKVGRSEGRRKWIEDRKGRLGGIGRCLEIVEGVGRESVGGHW